MEKTIDTDHKFDLLEKINSLKNCIKENTKNFSTDAIGDFLTFQTKDNIKIQIKLYK